MKKEKRNRRSHELIREMIELYHPQSIKDIQEMLKDMFADTMEDMLKAELDTELGYSKNSQAAKTTENRRNGSYPKTVTSSMGEIELNIPRDRMGEYDPELIPKGTKDVSALEEKVLSLYAKGTSDRDISDVINEIYGFSLSHETISNIVDRVQPRVIEWQNRRLDKVYPFVYMDALMVIKSHIYRALRRSRLKEMHAVRYADDFKIFCASHEEAVRVYKATELWLKDRLGLEVVPINPKSSI